VFKWNAKDYSKSSAEQEKWAQELISKLKLKGTERVLDIGCGDGKVTAAIANHLPNGFVLGIDSSEEMIVFAQKAFATEEYPNLSFKVMDAREINLAAEFDIVFSNAAIHWVTEHLSVLEGIKRSLKPFGKVLLQMGGRGNAADMMSVVDTIIGSDKWNRFFVDLSFKYWFFGPEEYLDWLKQASLKAKRVELIPKDMVHRGKEGLASWFRTTWVPYTQKVPESLQQEFIDEVTKKYMENYPADKDGFVHLQMMRLEVEAENG